MSFHLMMKTKLKIKITITCTQTSISVTNFAIAKVAPLMEAGDVGVIRFIGRLIPVHIYI